jgi:histidinol-phosphate aminotransferase
MKLQNLVNKDEVRLPYNINSLSQVTAGFFLDYLQEFAGLAAEIVKRREELYRGLENVEGIRPFPSQANFVFFSCAFDSDRIYKRLAAKGIIVKNLNSALMPDCI